MRHLFSTHQVALLANGMLDPTTLGALVALTGPLNRVLPGRI